MGCVAATRAKSSLGQSMQTASLDTQRGAAPCGQQSSVNVLCVCTCSHGEVKFTRCINASTEERTRPSCHPLPSSHHWSILSHSPQPSPTGQTLQILTQQDILLQTELKNLAFEPFPSKRESAAGFWSMLISPIDSYHWSTCPPSPVRLQNKGRGSEEGGLARLLCLWSWWSRGRRLGQALKCHFNARPRVIAVSRGETCSPMPKRQPLFWASLLSATAPGEGKSRPCLSGLWGRRGSTLQCFHTGCTLRSRRGLSMGRTKTRHNTTERTRSWKMLSSPYPYQD